MIIASALMLLKLYVVHIMTIILFIFINVHLSRAGSVQNYFGIVCLSILPGKFAVVHLISILKDVDSIWKAFWLQKS